MKYNPDLIQAKVDLGLAAKAEAKIDVRVDVPPASTGRLVDAITDLFRPFSERQGLKADQIRLQREEVLISIARLAHQRLEIENERPSAVVTKVLVPLLEKASCEEPEDNFMQRRWAELLASASMGKGSHPRFIQILSELSRKEV